MAAILLCLLLASSSISLPPPYRALMSASSASTTPPRRVLVIGGNGFVGSHILKELVTRKQAGIPLNIVSVSRSGLPPQQSASWIQEVEWNKGDVLAKDEGTKKSMTGASAVISCVGGFGSRETMVRVNGDANVNALLTAKSLGVPRFVYISAHQYVLPEFFKRGYFEGKVKTERAVESNYKQDGVIIRPGFVFGTRQVAGFGLPLWAIGSPLQKVTSFNFVRSLTTLPLIGPFLALPLTPPNSVESVARAAVDAALSDRVEKNVVEVDDLLKYEK